MEKNEAFRKQVLSRLYGISDPTESAKEGSSEDVKPEDVKSEDVKSEDTKESTDKDEEKKDYTLVKLKEETTATESESKSEKDESAKKTDTEKEEVLEEESSINKDKEDVKTDHSNNNGDSSTVANDNHDKSVSSSKGNATPRTTPTTTTSHLYSVLMSPLDGRSPYRDHNLRSASDQDTDSSQKKRMRLDSSSEKIKSENAAESGDHSDTKTTANTNSSVGMDLSKNQKKKQKKKKRRNLLNRIEVQRAKEFIYSSENEQYSVEKLRTMIEDVTEFLDAIWDVYCNEARLKGESVEEDGYRVAAVLKCLSASGEGSWGDLQLLSRAKSVLVLRSKNLAASTIARVENELGYDTDIRTFIVRMLKFWMDHVVTKA